MYRVFIKHKKYVFLTAVLLALFVPLVARVNAASTITVNSTADNQANDGACTLREAIIASNTDTASGAAVGECAAGSGAGDVIEFDISGTGLKTIHITSGLPSITRTVTIDGYTQTDAVVNTADFPDPMNGTLTVEIDAAGESGIYGIDINGSQADGTVIKGLIVNDIPYETFYLTDVDNVSLEGNYIGTSSTGNVADGGNSHGVRIGGNSTGNMIGGAIPAKRNVISGNGNTGVLFYGSALTTGNFVQGNYIGVGADGTTRIGNSQPGVFSGADATGNTIGGDGVGEGNVISGNGGAGVYLTGTGGANTVQGNHIGTNSAGSAGIYNGGGGIVISNADSNIIGGSTSGARNVISGNSAYGIYFTDDSDNNDIFGNYVGVNAAGDTDLGNGVYGIYVDTSSEGNEIGSGVSGTGNVISGNDDAGIIGSGDNTTVKGNYIGTNAAGTAAIGNTTDGVSLGGDGWIIGGTATNDKNVISGNGESGMRLNSASDATIEGNYIGTNAAGTADLGNTDSGVSLFGTSDSNVIGGSTSASRNVISGNGQHGVFLFNVGSTGNSVSGNYIGTGSDGTTDVGNTEAGVLVGASSNANIIGGDTAGEANLIRFNDNNGVIVSGTNNAIIGNSLYQNATPNIDLEGDDATANDANDADSGANDLLNYPEWSTYTESAGNTSVEYTLDVPAGDYRVETFSDNGKTLIDTQNITHTGSGSETFSNTITGDGYSAVRMTVTEIDGGLSSGFGSTSEYSEAYSDGTVTITVNSTADDEDDDGECTLREAIAAANDNTESGISAGECIAGAAEDTIEFDIAGGGVHTIQPISALPAITAENTTINGYSQTGAVENSGDYSECFAGTILIEIDGQNAGATSGLVVSANNATIRGLAINRFEQNGVNIEAVDGAVVAGNILGLDDAGLVDLGNGDAGVEISSSGDTLIGGTTAADLNLISGNEGYGGISSYADTGTVTISGNCIGTDATGDTAIPNNHYGINLFQNAANVVIGGNSTQERNIISGNDEVGIYLNDSSVDSIIGNYIGVNVDGVVALGNGGTGIYVSSDSSVSDIGGVTSGARNVVSGNGASGINLQLGTSGVSVRGNYVGLGADGVTDLGNTEYGVFTQGDNTIGGTMAGARNVISGNGSNGIAATNSTIIGNYIGLSADGTSSVTNGSASLANVALANNNQFGGTSANARNYIAGNNGTVNGISLTGTTFFGGSSTGDNVVQGNCIGTNSDCEVEAGFGVGVGLIVGFDTFNNVIGGTTNGAGNTIAGNREGITVLSLSSGGGFHPLNNSILGNSIYSNDGGLVSGIINLEGIGIDLLETPNFGSFPELGVTANDASDTDAGPNDYLNFPVLNSSSADAGSLNVNFDLDIPDSNSGVTGYRVEFFANDTGDSSGNGEGQIYLGHADVAGDVTNHSETITLDPGVITTGDYDISATVTEIDGSTDGFGATSEFSAFLNDQSVIQPLDNDDDGVNDAVENAGPNGGDGNDDGTLDSEQASVATILDAESDDYVTLALDPDGECNQIDDFASKLESELSESDPDYTYPLTLVEFTIPCADSVDGTIYWHGEEEFTNQIYRKFGPTTPGDSSTTSWYTAEQFITSTTNIGGEATATASFTLTDGEVGDDTGNDNVIVDANGPGLDQDSTDSVIDSISSAVSDALSNTGMNQYGIYVLAGALIVGGSSVIIKRKFFSKTAK